MVWIKNYYQETLIANYRGTMKKNVTTFILIILSSLVYHTIGQRIVISDLQTITGTYDTIIIQDGGTAILADTLTINNLLQVENGGTLDVDTFAIKGDGGLNIINGSNLIFKNISDGFIMLSGNVSIGNFVDYVLNGTETQDISNLPYEMRSITLDNPAGLISNSKLIHKYVLVSQGAFNLNGKRLSFGGNNGDVADTVTFTNNSAEVHNFTLRFEKRNQVFLVNGTNKLTLKNVDSQDAECQVLMFADIDLLGDQRFEKGSFFNLNGNTLTLRPGFDGFGSYGDPMYFLASEGGTIVQELSATSFNYDYNIITSEDDPVDFNKVKVSLTADAVGANASFSLQLNSIVHPEAIGAVTTDYITRFLAIDFTDVTNPSMNVEFNYLDADIEGTESYFEPGFADGIEWSKPAGQILPVANLIQVNNITTSGAITAGRFLGLDVIPCLAPELLMAENITFNSAELSWQVWKPEAITEYTPEYKTLAEATWTPVAPLTENSVVISGLTDDSQYEWRVSATCTSDYTPESEFSVSDTFSTQLDNGCMAPIGLTLDSLTSGFAYLSWNEVQSANDYQVEYLKETEGIWNVLNVSDTVLAIAVENENNYAVRIKTICDAFNSNDYSATLNFLSFIEGYNKETNSLYITSERNMPTVIDFDEIYIQDGGIATLTQDLTVGNKIVVQNGGSLNTGMYRVFGNTFVLEDGGNLGIGHSMGITSTNNNGNIQTIVRTYSSEAVYEYNGTSDQVTGDALNRYAKLIVNVNGVLDLGKRPTLRNYIQINSGQLKSSLDSYVYADLIIENNATPTATELLKKINVRNDGIKVKLQGSSAMILDFYFDKEGVAEAYTDIFVKSFQSYQSRRGKLYLNNANLVFLPDYSFGIDKVFFDKNSKFVQLLDASLLSNKQTYNSFFDSEGNSIKYEFTLTALDSSDPDAGITFNMVPRSHPERGGALNFVKYYLDIEAKNMNAFSANVDLFYAKSQVVGDETTFLAGYYHNDAWDYNMASIDTAANIISATGITESGEISAGYDFSLAAETCAIPSNLDTSNVDYQGVTLTWDEVSEGVDQYMVRYRKVAGSDTSWTYEEVQGAGPFRLEGLAYDQIYEWQVQTMCIPGYYAESAFSPIDVFITAPLKECYTPIGLTSQNITSQTVALSWVPVEGAVNYTLQYQEDGEVGWNTIQSNDQLQVELAGLNAATTYTWRIRSGCAAGYYETSSYTAVPKDFTTTPPCDTASGLFADNISYYSANLNWTPVASLDSQQIRFAAAGEVNWEYVSGIAGDNSQYQTQDVLLPETNYHWQIQSYCANGGISPYSTLSAFSTVPKPTCNVPVNLTHSVTTTTADFSWTSGESTAPELSWLFAYKLKDETDYTVTTTNTPEASLTGLIEGAAYEWKVKTNCDGSGYAWENSGWSQVQEFNTWKNCNAIPDGLVSLVSGWCSAELSWNEIPGITKYELRYRKTNETDWNYKTLGGKNVTLFSKGEPETTYEWQVRTYCFGTETNSEWSGSAEFTTQVDNGIACGAPTDNPYETKYGFAPDWTYDLPWETFVNITDFDDGTGYWDNALLNAMLTLAQSGGGVVYCPAGEYKFQNSVDVAPGIIIRGETPAVIDAKSADFAPPARFVFPEYKPVFSGTGTPNSTAFKQISSSGTRSNTGLVYLDINRAAVSFNVSMAPKEGYSTPQPEGDKKNVILFGLRSNNVAEPDPNVPAEGQHQWQRWGYRFSVNLSAYVSENGIITNNRVNDFENNNIHPIPEESFEMPGYLVDDNGSWVALEGYQARFNYAKHYGIELNRGKAYATFGTPEKEPSLYAPGNEIIDNWVYTTGRVGIMASGTGLVIKGNIKNDKAGKSAWVHPAGVKLVHNSATLENRGIDFSGFDVTISDNYLEVYNDLLKGPGGYLSVDGEGILIQECCGGSPVNGVLIENNTIKGSNAYIGIYKMRDINNVYILNNDLSEAMGQQSGHSIWVDANTNSNDYRADNVRIEGNKVRNKIALRASSGACNTYIVSNTGSGIIEAPCNTVVAENDGLTYDAVPCAPEAGCDMQSPPVISAFTPDEGAEDYTITLSGINLLGTDSIFIGNKKVEDFDVLDDVTLSFVIPTGAVTDKIRIYTNKAVWNTDHYIYPASAQSTSVLTIGEGVESLTLSPAPGYFGDVVEVTISSATDGASIYYTLDGTEPDENANLYNDKVVINTTTELNAIAYKESLYPSLVAGGTYSLQLIDADFTVAEVVIGDTSEFEAIVSVPFGNIEKIEWDFDMDGTFDAEGAKVSHKFDAEGDYNVKMLVTTDLGFTKEVIKPALVSTGIDELSLMETTLYPNPARNELNLVFSKALNGNNVRYSIIDLTGQTLLSERSGVVIGRDMSINISSLKNGKYYLRLIVDNEVVVKPFTIIK